MRNVILALTGLLLAACGDDPITPPPAVSLEGSWDLAIEFAGSQTFDGVTYAYSCSGATTAVLTDEKGIVAGQLAAGQGTCMFDGTEFEASFEGVLEGTREKTAVTLTLYDCTLKGAIVDNEINNGTLTCHYADETFTDDATGSWKLTS